MRQRADAITDAGRGFETVGWILAGSLLVLAFWLPASAAPGRRILLLAFVAAAAGLNLLARRLLPASAGQAYRREDALLAVGGGLTALLAAYLSILPGASTSLDALFLLPLVGAALELEARVTAAEALLAALAMVFLRAAAPEAGPFWSPEFVMRLAAFAAVSASLTVMTAGVRRRRAEASRLTEALAGQLGETRAFGALARQSGLTPDLDRLASGAGRILADAAGRARFAVFLSEGDDELRPFGEPSAIDRRDLEALRREEQAIILRGVFETGTARAVDAFAPTDAPAGIRDLLVLPLRAGRSTIGVLCLIDRRAEAGAETDAAACERLAAFAADLMHGALLCRRAERERHVVSKMSKLLVGRELKMRELKDRRGEPTRV